MLPNIATLTDIAGTFNSPEIKKLSNSIIKSGDNASSLNVGKLQKAVVEAVQISTQRTVPCVFQISTQRTVPCVFPVCS